MMLANDTKYGLAGSIYSEGDAATPFGGYKLPGFGGKDNGIQSHEQYTEQKTIWIDLSD